jgi:type IV secretion system pilin
MKLKSFFKNVITVLILTHLLLLPAISFAQAPAGPPAPNSMDSLTGVAAGAAGYSESTDSLTFAKILGTIVRTFLALLGVIFIIYIIFGGYQWMTAGGNEEQITKAKSIIKNGVIGLIIILSAAVIYKFIADFLIQPGSNPASGTGGG